MAFLRNQGIELKDFSSDGVIVKKNILLDKMNNAINDYLNCDKGGREGVQRANAYGFFLSELKEEHAILAQVAADVTNMDPSTSRLGTSTNLRNRLRNALQQHLGITEGEIENKKSTDLQAYFRDQPYVNGIGTLVANANARMVALNSLIAQKVKALNDQQRLGGHRP